ncbi:MAG: hypothetical protein ACTTHG_01010 [Treponemataceae bacterium]
MNLKNLVFNDEISTLEQVTAAYNSTLNCVSDDVERAEVEYMYGFYLINAKETELSKIHLDAAMMLSEAAFNENPSWRAYLIWARALSQNCIIQNFSYVLSNGLNVSKYAQKAVELNNDCGAAKYLIACTNIYAPPFFRNVKKGQKIIFDYIDQENLDIEDRFNAYITLGHIEYMEKKYDNAETYFAKAKEIYPDNKLLKSYLDRNYQPLSFEN